MILLLSLTNRRLIRHLRYRFGILEMFGAKVTRVGRRVDVRVLRALRRLMRRVGNELILSCSRIKGYLAQLLVFGGQLRVRVYLALLVVVVALLVEVALVDVGVRRLVRVSRYATQSGLLKLVEILHSQFQISHVLNRPGGATGPFIQSATVKAESEVLAMTASQVTDPRKLETGRSAGQAGWGY